MAYTDRISHERIADILANECAESQAGGIRGQRFRALANHVEALTDRAQKRIVDLQAEVATLRKENEVKDQTIEDLREQLAIYRGQAGTVNDHGGDQRPDTVCVREEAANGAAGT